MLFKIRALSHDQVVHVLQLEAADEAHALRQVADKGLFAADISRKGAWYRKRSARVGQGFSLTLFSQELLALLEAGLGVVESVEALFEKEANVSLKDLLGQLLRSLQDGQRFSSALAVHPQIFTPLYLGVVRAAEGTSDLPRSLRRFIDYQQRIDAVRNKVVGAAIYPAILLSVGTLVSLFLMVYVVPRFSEVYQGAGRELPWMSALLLNGGHFISAHLGGLLLVAGLCTFALAAAVRGQGFQGLVQRVLAAVPGLGERLLMYELARIYLTLGMLLEGGIAMIPAVDTVLQIVPVSMRTRLESAKRRVQEGVPLSEAFLAERLTTPISLRMLTVGERTGDIGQMLTKSAAFYDGEITRWLDRFMRSFEPILMAVIGVVIGVIVVLLYMPIFDLAGSF